MIIIEWWYNTVLLILAIVKNYPEAQDKCPTYQLYQLKFYTVCGTKMYSFENLNAQSIENLIIKEDNEDDFEVEEKHATETIGDIGRTVSSAPT